MNISKVVEFAVQRAAGRIPVIAGNGKNCTRSTVALTRALSHLDLAAFLCVTPYYNKPSRDGLVQHFTEVANATHIRLLFITCLAEPALI